MDTIFSALIPTATPTLRASIANTLEKFGSGVLAFAHERGVNYFDNAETYNNGVAEQVMGEVLADLKFSRDSYCVSSKVYFGAVDDPLPTQRGLSRKHVIEACHQALARLRVDYLDLYFCHRPDPDTPIAETVAAMDTLIRQGKVLYWGTSEWSVDAIRTAHEVAAENHFYAPVVEQPQYNLLHRERVEVEYAPLYAAYGMGTTIWSPLSSGLLSGKYNDGIPAGSRLAQPGYEWLRESVLGKDNVRVEKVRALKPIADELDISLAQLAIAWCLLNPHVSTVMLGASRREQLEHNLAALDALPKMDAQVAQRILRVVSAP